MVLFNHYSNMEIDEILKNIQYRSIADIDSNFLLNEKEGYIFRGQSNGNSKQHSSWKISSSFYRAYGSHFMTFTSYLLSIIDLINDPEDKKYRYEKLDNIKSLSSKEQLYLLQHYGIPTCLIDFTKDPKIALFFAMANIMYSSSFISDGEAIKNLNFDANRYLSVFQVNTNLLKEEPFNIEQMNYEKIFDNKYEISQYHPTVNIALDPVQEISDKNLLSNLDKQRGCFIFFDSSNYDIDLIQYLQEVLDDAKKNENKNITLDGPIITEHQFYLQDLITNDDKSLIHYVTKTLKITGKSLFDDIQGFRYDLNYQPYMWQF